MTKEDRILNNQLAIMSALKELLRFADDDSEKKDRINDRRHLANCCKDTISMLRGDADTVPDHYEFL